MNAWSARPSATVIKNASEAVEARQTSGDEEAKREQGHILVRCYASGRNLVNVDVIDNGKGLPRQNRAKLLEPYMTTREKGTGLGLAIVKKIMEDHDGQLQLHDAPKGFHGGRGAMVRLVFPRAVAAASEELSGSETVSVESGAIEPNSEKTA